MIQERIKIQVQGSEDYAHLDTYILGNYLDDEPNPRKPLVLICPGGAYRMTSNREAEPIALQFNSIGYHAAVLRYSCKPAVYPTALLEVAKSVQLIREKGEEWGIDTEKILVMGFSAGGHLVASYGVFWKELEENLNEKVRGLSLQPNGLILCYPVISSQDAIAHTDSIQNLLGSQYEEKREKLSLENQVGDWVPKTFIWHTFDDDTVPFWNSMVFVEALGKANVPVEFHLYPKGAHGLSLATKSIQRTDGSGVEPGCQSWMPLLLQWIQRNFGF